MSSTNAVAVADIFSVTSGLGTVSLQGKSVFHAPNRRAGLQVCRE